MKYLIINADDFGYSKGINKGIIHAHKYGVLTSTSVMVNRLSANEAKHLSKYPMLSVGLHFDITEENIKGLFMKYKKITFDSKKQLRKDFYNQITKFKELTNKLPDHLDSHHHVHTHPRVKPIFVEFSNKHDIPVRAYGNTNFIDKFFGWNKLKAKAWHKIEVEYLIKIFSSLKDGVNEVMSHAGYVDKDLEKISKYLREREIEVETLTNKKVGDFINKSGIRLCSWKDIKKMNLFKLD